MPCRRVWAGLPDSAFAHFWGGLWQLVGVSVVTEGHGGVGRAGPTHLTVHRARYVGLRTGWVRRVVGHRVGETLHLSGTVVPRVVVVVVLVVYDSQWGASGDRGGHEAQVCWSLSLGRWRALEVLVIPSRAVVFSGIICVYINIWIRAQKWKSKQWELFIFSVLAFLFSFFFQQINRQKHSTSTWGGFIHQ